MFHRLTDFMKNGIDQFLSQELSPEEIEEMRLDEGLRLEDVKRESLDDLITMLKEDNPNYTSPKSSQFLTPLNPNFFPLGACDYDFRNPLNDD